METEDSINLYAFAVTNFSGLGPVPTLSHSWLVDFSPSSVSKPQMAPPLFAFGIRHYVKNHSYIIIFLVAFASLGAAIHSAACQFGTARDKMCSEIAFLFF